MNLEHLFRRLATSEKNILGNKPWHLQCTDPLLPHIKQTLVNLSGSGRTTVPDSMVVDVLYNVESDLLQDQFRAFLVAECEQVFRNSLPQINEEECTSLWTDFRAKKFDAHSRYMKNQFLERYLLLFADRCVSAMDQIENPVQNYLSMRNPQGRKFAFLVFQI